MAVFTWGQFVFASELPINTMQRTTTERQIRQDRLDGPPIRQWTGEEDDRMQITGTIFPLSLHGRWGKLVAQGRTASAEVLNEEFEQVERLRLAMKSGDALPLLTGGELGEDAIFLGHWLLLSVQETPGDWLPGGHARRQPYTVQLARQADDFAPESPRNPSGEFPGQVLEDGTIARPEGGWPVGTNHERITRRWASDPAFRAEYPNGPPTAGERLRNGLADLYTEHVTNAPVPGRGEGRAADVLFAPDAQTADTLDLSPAAVTDFFRRRTAALIRSPIPAEVFEEGQQWQTGQEALRRSPTWSVFAAGSGASFALP